MQITVKLFAYFRDNRFTVRQWDIGDGTTVGKIVDTLAIDRDEVGVLMVNSRHAAYSTVLAPEDILAIFPVVGGG